MQQPILQPCLIERKQRALLHDMQLFGWLVRSRGKGSSLAGVGMVTLCFAGLVPLFGTVLLVLQRMRLGCQPVHGGAPCLVSVRAVLVLAIVIIDLRTQVQSQQSLHAASTLRQ